MRKSRKVDTDLLTREEQRQYRQLSLAISPAAQHRWDRSRRRTLVVVGVVAFVAMTAVSTSHAPFLGAVASGAVVAAILLLPTFIVLEVAEDARHGRIVRGQVAEFLAEIGYDGRTKPPSRPRRQVSDDAGPGNPYWATGEYDPVRFEQIRRSHSRYELRAMRDYGMTPDEWDANRPD